MNKKAATLSVFALALSAAMLGSRAVSAGAEADSLAGFNSLGETFARVREVLSSRLAKLPGVPSRGIYGKDHCSPYDDTMVPVNDGNGDGENGYYCVSRKPASVSCSIVGWRETVEEGGVVLRPILGECNPRGGFAGTPLDQGLQSP